MSGRTGIQLCYPFEEKRLTQWRSPYIIQPKLDGDRCRAIIDQYGHVTLLSSEERVIEGLPHIVDALENSGLKGIEFDGELYHHEMPHSEIHGAVSRKVNISDSYDLIQYHIFDIVSGELQAARLNTLYDMKSVLHDPIYIVPLRMVYNLDDIMARYEEYLEGGYEGFILRNAWAPYQRKRVTTMLKFKPKKSDTYMIVGFEEEISIHGIPKGALGALVLDSNLQGTRFRVGTGFSREQREYLWKERVNIIGQWCRISYQHMTTARGVPRFPVFMYIEDSSIENLI